MAYLHRMFNFWIPLAKFKFLTLFDFVLIYPELTFKSYFFSQIYNSDLVDIINKMILIRNRVKLVLF